MATYGALNFFGINQTHMMPNSMKERPSGPANVENSTLAYHIVNDTNRLAVGKKIRFIHLPIWQFYLLGFPNILTEIHFLHGAVPVIFK